MNANTTNNKEALLGDYNNSVFFSGIELFFKNIKRENSYEPSQEQEYIKRIKKGDKKAKDDFIRYNLQLVAQIAYKYINRGIPLEDLIQIGSLGLLKALDSYKTNRGSGFATCAKIFIREKILESFYHIDMIRYPEGMKDRFKILRRIERQSGTTLTDEELLKKSRLTQHYISLYRQYRLGIDSIERILEVTEKTKASKFRSEISYDTFEETIVTDVNLKSILERFRLILTERQFKVICMRFGLYDDDYMTQPEVGEIIGISSQRVAQLESQAKKKIKNNYSREDIY